MTATSTIPTLSVETTALEAVTFDFYRDIHKGIRSGLFGVTLRAGNVDPGDDDAVAAVAEQWRRLSAFLVRHAEHEEDFVQPVLEEHAPVLAAQVIPAHRLLESRAAALEMLGDRATNSCADQRRLLVHRLYLGLAGFTSAYMVHQEFEELEVMPALSEALRRDDLIAIDSAIVASLSPEEVVESGAMMLPAMNVEDRVELVGGMKEAMPPEVFEGVWGLVASVLEARDFAQLGARLGITVA